MSAHDLLNSLSQLEKRDKMQGLPSIMYLFGSEFNIFNNTGAGMLDSIDHMTLNYFEFKILSYIRDIITALNNKRYQNLLTTSGLSIIMHGVISLPETTS